MAGSKGSKYYDVFLKFKVWLENTKGQGILGDGKFELLEGSGRKTRIYFG